jgi:hypothetical protein
VFFLASLRSETLSGFDDGLHTKSQRTVAGYWKVAMTLV